MMDKNDGNREKSYLKTIGKSCYNEADRPTNKKKTMHFIDDNLKF